MKNKAGDNVKTALTCVSRQRRRRDDGFVLAEVRALPHVVFEGSLGLVALQGGGVVLGVEAVVRRYPLQAAERGLAAPRLGQPVAALEALDALEGVLAAKLTWEPKGIFFLKNITFLQCPLKSHPPPKKKKPLMFPVNPPHCSAEPPPTPSHTSFPFYSRHLGLILSGRRSHKLP